MHSYPSLGPYPKLNPCPPAPVDHAPPQAAAPAPANAPQMPDGAGGAYEPPPPPPGVFAFASSRGVHVSADVQQRAAALLAADADADAEAALDAAGAEAEGATVAPPPSMFAFASGRGVILSAAAQQRAAALLAADTEADNERASDARGADAAEAAIAPPPGVFAFASGRCMQVSAAAQQRATALLAADSIADAEAAADAAGADTEGVIMPPPPGVFAFASGRGVQVSAAAQYRAAALLAADTDADAEAGTDDEGMAMAPMPGVFAFASGRNVRVSAAAQQRAAALLAADADAEAAPDAPSAGAAGTNAVQLGKFAFASGRSVQVSAAAQHRAADLLAADAELTGGGGSGGEPAAGALDFGIEMPSLGDDSAALALLRAGEERHAAAAALGSGLLPAPAAAPAGPGAPAGASPQDADELPPHPAPCSQTEPGAAPTSQPAPAPAPSSQSEGATGLSPATLAAPEASPAAALLRCSADNDAGRTLAASTAAEAGATAGAELGLNAWVAAGDAERAASNGQGHRGPCPAGPSPREEALQLPEPLGQAAIAASDGPVDGCRHAAPRLPEPSRQAAPAAGKRVADSGDAEDDKAAMPMLSPTVPTVVESTDAHAEAEAPADPYSANPVEGGAAPSSPLLLVPLVDKLLQAGAGPSGPMNPDPGRGGAAPPCSSLPPTVPLMDNSEHGATPGLVIPYPGEVGVAVATLPPTMPLAPPAESVSPDAGEGAEAAQPLPGAAESNALATVPPTLPLAASPDLGVAKGTAHVSPGSPATVSVASPGAAAKLFGGTRQRRATPEEKASAAAAPMSPAEPARASAASPRAPGTERIASPDLDASAWAAPVSPGAPAAASRASPGTSGSLSSQETQRRPSPDVHASPPTWTAPAEAGPAAALPHASPGANGSPSGALTKRMPVPDPGASAWARAVSPGAAAAAPGALPGAAGSLSGGKQQRAEGVAASSPGSCHGKRARLTPCAGPEALSSSPGRPCSARRKGAGTRSPGVNPDRDPVGDAPAHEACEPTGGAREAAAPAPAGLGVGGGSTSDHNPVNNPMAQPPAAANCVGWAMANGRHRHVDAAKVLAAARAHFGACPAGGGASLGGIAEAAVAVTDPVRDPRSASTAARVHKRAPLAERGVPGEPLSPEPKRRNPGEHVGSAVGVSGHHADTGGLSKGASCKYAAGGVGVPAPAGRGSGSGDVGRTGSAGEAGTPDTGALSGSGPNEGTARGRRSRRATGGLTRSAGGSTFKAPRRFISPMRNRGLAKARTLP